MRVPFPLNLTVGTDIIAYRRLLRPHASSTYLHRLASRFLHPNELGELHKRYPDWHPSNKVSSADWTRIGAHIAGRWAAKEAAKKAWGATLISFRDLRVETLPDGQVQIVCQSYQATPTSLDGRRNPASAYEQVGKLSISHDGDYATATVIATPLHPEIVADLQASKSQAMDRVLGFSIICTQEPAIVITVSMDGGSKFIDPTRFQHDPRHTAVDVYTKEHLLRAENNPKHDALEYAYHDSLEHGCPDISTTAAHGKFLAMQAKMKGAKNILEVGTLGGYSAIWIATASEDVKITTVEIKPEWKDLAEDHFRRASVDGQINVLLGPAKDVLMKLREEIHSGKRDLFDFVFIDADKDNNTLYFKLVLDLVKPQTPIFVDNVVRHGDLADSEAAKKDSRVQGARDLVEYAGTESRVDAVVMQTVSEKDYDGFMMAIVK